MTLPEQVARALCQAAGRAPDHCVQGSGGISYGEKPEVTMVCHQRAWEQHKGQATAAIRVVLEALRGLDVVMRENGQVVHELRGSPNDTWKMLMEAAIRELGVEGV